MSGKSERRFQLSDAAQASLDEIYAYTLRTWGERQAETYISNLFDLFAAIADGQERGWAIQKEYGVGGFYARCGKHFAYWYWHGEDLRIAEILHERMNIGDRLCEGGNLP